MNIKVRTCAGFFLMLLACVFGFFRFKNHAKSIKKKMRQAKAPGYRYGLMACVFGFFRFKNHAIKHITEAWRCRQ